MHNFCYIQLFEHIFRRTAETCNKANMRISHAMNGSTEGSILVSHIILDVCFSLTLINERHANRVDLVKLQKKASEVIFNKLWR